MYSQTDEVMLHCPVLQGFVEIQSSSDAHDVDWRIIVNGVNKSTLNEHEFTGTKCIMLQKLIAY